MLAVYDCEKRCSLHEPFFLSASHRPSHRLRGCISLARPNALSCPITEFSLALSVCPSVSHSFSFSFPLTVCVYVSATTAISLYRRHWCRETRRGGDVNLTGLSRRKSVYRAVSRSRFSPVRFYLPSPISRPVTRPLRAYQSVPFILFYILNYEYACLVVAETELSLTIPASAYVSPVKSTRTRAYTRYTERSRIR